MNIYLGADHAGFAFKEIVKEHLLHRSVDDIVVDHGASAYQADDDYPDFILPVAHDVARDWRQGTETSFGIIFGASGQGEAIVANRISGIRAVVYYGGQPDIITLSRTHNNANILSLGAAFLTKEMLCDIVDTWLATPFSGDQRHRRRIKKIDHHA